MDRKMYQPTKNQERKWTQFQAPEMPSDDEFRARWAKAHHGKGAGWGMGKRDWVLSQMTQSREYQLGIWQGRVDAARGLGYYRGYSNYASDRRGWDRDTCARFDAQYIND